MSIAGFNREKMMKKGTKEGMWAGGSSVLVIGLLSLLRAAEVVPWAEEHDTVVLAMLIPALVAAIKMLRNFMQEMGFTLNKEK